MRVSFLTNTLALAASSLLQDVSAVAHDTIDTAPGANLTAIALTHALAITHPTNITAATLGSPLNITWVTSGEEGTPETVNLILLGAYKGGDFHHCGVIGENITNTGWLQWDIEHVTVPSNSSSSSSSSSNTSSAFECPAWAHIIDEPENTAFVINIGDAQQPKYGMYSRTFCILPPPPGSSNAISTASATTAAAGIPTPPPA